MPTVSSGTVGRNCSSSSADPLLMEEWSSVVTVACDLLLGTVTFLVGVSFSMQGWKKEKMVLPVLLSLWYRSPRTAMHFSMQFLSGSVLG